MDEKMNNTPSIFDGILDLKYGDHLVRILQLHGEEPESI